jgi:hypothetical protein
MGRQTVKGSKPGATLPNGTKPSSGGDKSFQMNAVRENPRQSDAKTPIPFVLG